MNWLSLRNKQLKFEISGELSITLKELWNMGASTLKWTTFDPCSGLSESDPKLYTNFDLYEIEIHKHLESI
jgi:hypothetical protein